MGTIFDKQTFLRIVLTYTADVTDDIDSVKIKYRKPDGTTGEWAAVHDTVNKAVYYDFEKGKPLDLSGRWYFWIYAVMKDERILIGEATHELIKREGYDK